MVSQLLILLFLTWERDNRKMSRSLISFLSSGISVSGRTLTGSFAARHR
jgi:hypothetical protein